MEGLPVDMDEDDVGPLPAPPFTLHFAYLNPPSKR
jgi:hypothetical protein